MFPLLCSPGSPKGKDPVKCHSRAADSRFPGLTSNSPGHHGRLACAHVGPPLPAGRSERWSEDPRGQCPARLRRGGLADAGLAGLPHGRDVQGTRVGRGAPSEGARIHDPPGDWAGEVSEFLLVPYVGACVHTPPPPPNQLVYRSMDNGQRVPVSFWEPIWIHAPDRGETTNLYGSVSFKIAGTSITPYAW